MFGNAQRKRRSHQVALRRVKHGGIAEEVVYRYFVPTEQVQGIQVIDYGQGVDLMQARNDAAVFDVGQTADMQHEIGPAAVGSQLEAGPLDVPVRQTEALTYLT